MTKEYDDAIAMLSNVLRMPHDVHPLDKEAREASSSLATQMENASVQTTGICWGWSADDSPESWLGAFSTREAAIADARAHSWSTFFVAHGRRPEPSSFMPNADTIIDMIKQSANDAATCDATEDFPDVSSGAEKELDVLLSAWAKKHLTSCNFWIVDPEAKPEKIVPGAE